MTEGAPERRDPKRLVIFDFDSTLFRSPGPPPGATPEQRKDYWQSTRSLGHPAVPPKPNDNWYLQEQVDDFEKARKDPDTYLVVMTGRKEPFRFAVERLLKNLDLKPDELILKDPNQRSTEKYKTKAIHKLLDQMPSIQSVEFYEDRHDHLETFQKSVEERGLEFTPHPVEFENPRQTWDEYLDTFHESGKRKIRNPNPDTRDQYPEVTVGYLLQNDEKFRWKLQRDFREWVTQGRPDADSAKRVASAWLRLFLAA